MFYLAEPEFNNIAFFHFLTWYVCGSLIQSRTDIGSTCKVTGLCFVSICSSSQLSSLVRGLTTWIWKTIVATIPIDTQVTIRYAKLVLSPGPTDPVAEVNPEREPVNKMSLIHSFYLPPQSTSPLIWPLAAARPAFEFLHQQVLW